VVEKVQNDLFERVARHTYAPCIRIVDYAHVETGLTPDAGRALERPRHIALLLARAQHVGPREMEQAGHQQLETPRRVVEVPEETVPLFGAHPFPMVAEQLDRSAYGRQRCL